MTDPPSNPFHAPAEVAGTTSSQGFGGAHLFACLLWVGMAIKLVVFQGTLRFYYEAFDAELPALTVLLLHPLATVFFFTSAAALVLFGLIAKTADDRHKIGVIGCVLGVLALAALDIGLFWTSGCSGHRAVLDIGLFWTLMSILRALSS